MVRCSIISILLSSIVHLLRFGHSSSLWYFLIISFLILLLLIYGDDFGFFENSTGWLRGVYVDEPTPPIILKTLLFLTLLGFCIVFAFKRDLSRKRWGSDSISNSLPAVSSHEDFTKSLHDEL